MYCIICLVEAVVLAGRKIVIGRLVRKLLWQELVKELRSTHLRLKTSWMPAADAPDATF